MSRKYFSGVMMAGMMAGLVGFPVFAEEPVDIKIIEKVDDGAGGYKPWEDISGAMPGMTYSAIPAVENIGELPTYVWMCLSQTAINGIGNEITLRRDVFDINIDSSWIPETDRFSTMYLGAGKCYRYNAALEAEDISRAVFTEVTLSPMLANEYQNATFNLRLDAYAMDEIPVMPDDQDDSDTPTKPANPDNPNTGATTKSEPLTAAGYVSLSIGLVVLVGMVLYLLWSRRRKS